MNGMYDHHSWSKLHREEALKEAQRRRKAQQAKGTDGRRFFGLADTGSVLSGALGGLRS